MGLVHTIVDPNLCVSSFFAHLRILMPQELKMKSWFKRKGSPALGDVLIESLSKLKPLTSFIQHFLTFKSLLGNPFSALNE